MRDGTARRGRRHRTLSDHRPVHDPKIALVPLFIIWFGIGEGSKLATLSFGVFFLTAIATAGGAADASQAVRVTGPGAAMRQGSR